MARAESSLAGCQKGRIMRTEGAASVRETAAFAVFSISGAKARRKKPGKIGRYERRRRAPGG